MKGSVGGVESQKTWVPTGKFRTRGNPVYDKVEVPDPPPGFVPPEPEPPPETPLTPKEGQLPQVQAQRSPNWDPNLPMPDMDDD